MRRRPLELWLIFALCALKAATAAWVAWRLASVQTVFRGYRLDTLETIAICAVWSVLAIGLIARQRWARWAAIVWFALIIGVAIWRIAQTFRYAGFRPSAMFSNLTTAVVTGLVLYLLTLPHVSAAFRKRRA